MTAEQALSLVDGMPELRWVKVGLELFTAAGPSVVQRLRERGLRIFLDLKFHDIPATMAGACRSAVQLGAELITVHACAGVEALRQSQAAATSAAERAGLAQPPTLLAVTVLTSWSAPALARELQLQEPLPEVVLRRVDLALEAGLGGCVCSPLEVAVLRERYPVPFQLVTPGIRPRGAARDDQKRVLTPAEALQAGASRLVIGRPITTAPDPAAAFAACCAELDRPARAGT